MLAFLSCWLIIFSFVLIVQANLVVDMLFLTDVLLNFRTGYKIHEDDKVIVTDPKKVLAAGWFELLCGGGISTFMGFRTNRLSVSFSVSFYYLLLFVLTVYVRLRTAMWLAGSSSMSSAVLLYSLPQLTVSHRDSRHSSSSKVSELWRWWKMKTSKQITYVID